MNESIDFWSLGCIIYFMITGKDPFPSLEQISKMMNPDPKKPNYDEASVFNRWLLNLKVGEVDWTGIKASPEVKLIVQKLLQPCETMRLGSGKEESQQHISKLEIDRWFNRKKLNGKDELIDHANIYQEEIYLCD